MLYNSIDLPETNRMRTTIAECIYHNCKNYNLYTINDEHEDPFNSPEEYKTCKLEVVFNKSGEDLIDNKQLYYTTITRSMW